MILGRLDYFTVKYRLHQYPTPMDAEHESQ